MSGYNQDTGIFSLIFSKVDRYIGRNKKIKFPIEEDWKSFCIKLFKEKGFTVVRKTEYGIDVVADNAQVWEVLSGEKPTWGFAKPTAQEVYEKYINKKKEEDLNKIFFTATELGKKFNVPISGIKVNKLLEENKYQEKINDSWNPTVKAKDLCKVKENPYNADKPNIFWHKDIIELIQKH